MTYGHSFDPHWCTAWQSTTAELECAGKGTQVCSLGERLRENDFYQTIFQWQQVGLIFMVFLILMLAKHLYRIPYFFLLKEADVKEALAANKDEDEKDPNRDSTVFKVGDKLMADKNTAVAISFAGYMAALFMVFLACISELEQGEDITAAKYTSSGSSKTYSAWSEEEWDIVQGNNVWGTAVFVAMGVLMLTIARMVNDFATTGVDEAINIAIKRENASGILEACSYLSTGLVLSSALSGRSASWGVDMVASWTYFVLGQLLYLMTVYKFRLLDKHQDTFKQIGYNNYAVAISVGLETLSNAVVISYAIYVDSSLVMFVFCFSVGFVANWLSRKFADVAILPEVDLDEEIHGNMQDSGKWTETSDGDRNWGAALVAGAVQISASLMIMSLPATSCDDLKANVKDALTDTDKFDMVFKSYQLILLALIPLILLIPRFLYIKGLQLSGGIPDLDFLISSDEQDPEAPEVRSDSNPGLPAGMGNGATGEGGDVAMIQLKEGSAPESPAAKPAEVAATEPAGVSTEPAGGKQWFRGQPSAATPSASATAGTLNIDDLLTKRDNKSVAISYAGYTLGLAIMYRGTVSASVYDFPAGYDIDDEMTDLLPTLVLLALGIFSMFLCHLINDKIIIPNIRNIDALNANAKSAAVGIVEAGSFIATGQILGAASYGYVDAGDTDSWGEAIFMQFFWFILGQTSMILVSAFANMLSGGNAKDEVKKNNHAAAVFLACRLITGSAVVANPIGQSDSVVTYGVMLPLGIVFVQVCKYWWRLALACGADYSDEQEGRYYSIIIQGKPFKKNKNWGNALVEGVVMISCALVFGSFLRGCGCFDQYSAQLV
jgi:uncharacterized membrane protein YjfL (UPF0719 family)